MSVFLRTGKLQGGLARLFYFSLQIIIAQRKGFCQMSNWKREELKIAKEMNSKRALQKGTDTKEDVEHNLFVIDSKLRKAWRVDVWYDELKRYADKKGKIPILVLRKPGRKRRLAVIDFDYFNSLCKGAGINPDSDQGANGEKKEAES